jgi:hypothetical protein
MVVFIFTDYRYLAVPVFIIIKYEWKHAIPVPVLIGWLGRIYRYLVRLLEEITSRIIFLFHRDLLIRNVFFLLLF